MVWPDGQESWRSNTERLETKEVMEKKRILRQECAEYFGDFRPHRWARENIHCRRDNFSAEKSNWVDGLTHWAEVSQLLNVLASLLPSSAHEGSHHVAGTEAQVWAQQHGHLLAKVHSALAAAESLSSQQQKLRQSPDQYKSSRKWAGHVKTAFLYRTPSTLEGNCFLY